VKISSSIQVHGEMALQLPVLQLQLELEEEEEDNDAVIAAVAYGIANARRRERRWWVRPWIQRRPFLGQYETLFAELDRESHGDYMAFIRIDRNLFAEVLQRVSPRITKGPR
jgi:hypothetical protein